MSSRDAVAFGVSSGIPVALKSHEQHRITIIGSRENAMSLAVSVDEVHDLSNFSQRVGFKLVFSLDFFKPVLYLERTHGKSPFPAAISEAPTDLDNACTL
jgi:hypothetical protein